MWRQIISDVCGIETTFMDGAQGAPFGDAVMAGVALGVFSSYRVVKGWLHCSHRTSPDPSNHARYQRLFDLYLDLYESLKPNFAALEELYRPSCCEA